MRISNSPPDVRRVRRLVAAGVATLCSVSFLVTPAHAQKSGDGPAGREQGGDPSIGLKPDLGLGAAHRVAEAVKARAAELGVGGAVAVVDDGGHLLLLERIDGTFPAAAEVAYAKARTAAVFRRATRVFENAIRSGRTSLVAVGPMTPLEGGVPIVIDGSVAGAVGVSGAASSAQDDELATLGAAILDE